MKIQTVALKNYRAYEQATTLKVSPITALVGPNGIGKSSVLEALDLFFNKSGFAKDEDGTVGNDQPIEIAVTFADLPEGFRLDEDATTSFEKEPYLLNKEGLLVVRKTYKRASLGVNNPKVEIQCALPSADMVEIIGEANTSLKKRIKELKLEAQCDQSINATMRRALYDYYLTQAGDNSEEHWVDIQKRQEGLDSIMPHFALFKSDRLNSSKDAEVSEPVKYAIQSAVKEAVEEIEAARTKVGGRIQDILNRANATLAESFGNAMPEFEASVADDVAKAFSASLNDKKGIPLEKQGSGIRRLYMFNLLISEARRKAAEASRATIIYGIEEPETSQHPDFQEKLIQALKQLAQDNQVILTTHNPNLLSKFSKDAIRAVRGEHPKITDCSAPGTLKAIVEGLGLLPDPLPNAKFRAVLIVEGTTDVTIFQRLRALHPTWNTALQDVWLVHGGGDTIRDWVRSDHFCAAGVPQFFLVDNDFTPTGGRGQTYGNLQKALRDYNRPDLQYLLPMRRREIEQYLHPNALKRCLESHGINTTGLDAIVVGPLDNIRLSAASVFQSIATHRTTAVPFSTPPAVALTIQDQLAGALRGYSLLNDGHKKLTAEVIFNEMQAAEVTERFRYIDESGNAQCELTDWANKITETIREIS